MARTEADDALLSVAQAASLLGVHPNTIRAWTDGGRLTAYRINARGDRRFRRDDVARLLVEDGASGEAAAAPAGSGDTARDRKLAIFGCIDACLATSSTSARLAWIDVEVFHNRSRGATGSRISSAYRAIFLLLDIIRLFRSRRPVYL